MAEEQKTKIFADGIRFERPREGSPEWVKGKISIKVEDFIKFCKDYKGDTGWINLDLKKSATKGTLYLELNQWKPTKKDEEKDPEDLPM